MNQLFIEGCINGNLKNIKYIISLHVHDVDNFCSEAFATSALYGKVNVMKYLIEYYYDKIDIHMENNLAFRWAIESGNILLNWKKMIINKIQKLYHFYNNPSANLFLSLIYFEYLLLQQIRTISFLRYTFFL